MPAMLPYCSGICDLTLSNISKLANNACNICRLVGCLTVCGLAAV